MLSSIAWNIFALSVHSLVLPLRLRDVLICHSLRHTTIKVQEYVLKHLTQYFPLNNFLRFSNQSNGQLLLEFYSGIFCILILEHTKWPRLASSMALYHTYINFLKIVLNRPFLESILPSYVYRIGLNTYNYLFPIKIKETAFHKKNAEEIKLLTKKVQEITSPSTLNNCIDVDPITLDPPTLPVEIDTHGHFLDANSLRMYQKETCPMCRGKLSPGDYTVSTKVQERIIKQLQEVLQSSKSKRDFSHLPSN